MLNLSLFQILWYFSPHYSTLPTNYLTLGFHLSKTKKRESQREQENAVTLQISTKLKQQTQNAQCDWNSL